MSKTSSVVKARWNAKNYDTFQVYMPKGMKERLKAKCEREGVSMNSIFAQAAKKFLGEE